MKIITALLLLANFAFSSSSTQSPFEEQEKQIKDTIKKYKYGFINIRTGKEITPFKYDRVYDFKDEVAIVMLNKKYGLIDRTGQEITAIKYDSIGNYKDGSINVTLNEKYGLIDGNGKELIPIKYDEVASYNDGLAVVRNKKKYGVVNSIGEEILPIQYDHANILKNIIIAKNNEKYGAFDKSVLPICSFINDNIDDVEVGYSSTGEKDLRVILKDEMTIFDLNGRVVSKNKIDKKIDENYGCRNDLYRKPQKNTSNYIKLKKRGKWIYTDNYGSQIEILFRRSRDPFTRYMDEYYEAQEYFGDDDFAIVKILSKKN